MPSLVSVLMPVYNCASYIREAVESIIRQTYSDFELIIVDDHSSDESFSIISEYKDPRIKKYRSDVNEGAGSVLQRGLNLCTGEYIAIMHGDDIAVPKRIEKQVLFMINNPGIGILGTQFREIDRSGQFIHKRQSSLPCETEIIKYSMLFNNCLCHPSVMIRKNLLDLYNLNYKTDSRLCEDYELWTEAIFKGVNIRNLPLKCLYYRRHEKQASVEKAEKETKIFNELRNKYRDGFNDEIKYVLRQIDELTFSGITNLANCIKKLALEKSIKKIFFDKISFFIHGALKSGKSSDDFSLSKYFKYLRIAGWNSLKIQILYRLALKSIR